MEVTMNEKRSSQLAIFLIFILVFMALGMPAFFGPKTPADYDGISKSEVQAVLDDVSRIPR